MKHFIPVLVILLLVLASFVGESFNIKNSTAFYDGNILYVGGGGPDNYTKIQDAIDNSSDGDTVFVFDDSSPYYEELVINKPISLVGENKYTTIIDGNFSNEEDIIYVEGNGACVSNFRIQNCDWYPTGINVRARYTNISNNIIGPEGGSISLRYSTGNIVDSNIISENSNGIGLYESNENTISNNVFLSNNNAGISLSSSDKNIISNNLIYEKTNGSGSSFYKAISLGGSNNILLNNTVVGSLKKSYIGISLSGTSNKLYGNKLVNCSINILSFDHTMESNTVNDKPIVYFVDESDKTIDNAGQVILVQCDNITIKKLKLSKTYTAINLQECTNCMIYDNWFSQNYYCLKLTSSNNNRIYDNNVLNSSGGVYLYSSKHNEILSNNITNTNTGIILAYSPNSKISGNRIYDSHSTGILVSSSFSRIINNIIINCSTGISIQIGSKNSISKNEIINNGLGIFLALASFNTISKNNLMKNDLNALFDNSIRNHWVRNYWGRIKIGPKIVIGFFSIPNYDPWGSPTIIPWMNFDWRPRILPYKIT